MPWLSVASRNPPQRSVSRSANVSFPFASQTIPRERGRVGGERGKEILPWPDTAEAGGVPSNRGINLLSLAPKSSRSRSDGIVIAGWESRAEVGSSVKYPLDLAQKPQKSRLRC